MSCSACVQTWMVSDEIHPYRNLPKEIHATFVMPAPVDAPDKTLTRLIRGIILLSSGTHSRPLCSGEPRCLARELTAIAFATRPKTLLRRQSHLPPESREKHHADPVAVNFGRASGLLLSKAATPPGLNSPSLSRDRSSWAYINLWR